MIGEVVGNYEILKSIGQGGMGAVYVARHKLIGRKVAIKVLLPAATANEELVQRFFNEARSTSDVKHAGLIDVFDFGYHNGNAYIAMEFLEGESLASRLKREHATTEFVIGVGRQVASALGAAHAHGIVHRDLKPDNVFLVPDDEAAIGVRAKVLDFGIAKLTGEQGSSLKTQTNSLMGTPAYMSPEQCRGAKAVDARSDIYSLGCILYEMTTGRIPFVAQGLGEMMMMHMIEPPTPPRALQPDIPEWLEQVIQRTMAKEPADRYQTMDELASVLAAQARALRSTPPPMIAVGTPMPNDLRTAADNLAARSSAFGVAATMASSPALPTPALALASSPALPTPSLPSSAALPTPALPSMSSLPPVASPSGMQSIAQPAPARSKVPIMVGAALVAVGLGVGVFMLVSARGGSSSKTAAAPPQETTSATTATASPATAPATAAPVAAPTPPPVAPVPPPVAEQPEPAPQQAPAMVTVVVESKPVGAEVFAVADGAILGITPLTLRRPQGTSPIAIVVKAKRRKPANSEVSFAKDDTVRVDLDKIGTRPVRDPKPTGSTTTPTNQPSTLPDGTVDPFSRMKTRDKQ